MFFFSSLFRRLIASRKSFFLLLLLRELPGLCSILLWAFAELARVQYTQSSYRIAGFLLFHLIEMISYNLSAHQSPCFFPPSPYRRVSIRVARTKKKMFYISSNLVREEVRQWAVRECNRITVGSMEGGRWKNRKTKSRFSFFIFLFFDKKQKWWHCITYSHQRAPQLLLCVSASRYIVWILYSHIWPGPTVEFLIFENLFFFPFFWRNMAKSMYSFLRSYYVPSEL